MLKTRLHHTLFALVLGIDLLIVAAFLVFGNYNAILNNAIDIWFEQSDPALPAFQREQDRFGKGSWIYINVWAKDSDAAARLSPALTTAFRATDGIVSVLSPHSIEVLQKDGEGLFYDSLGDEVNWPQRQALLASHPIAGTVLMQPNDPNRIGFLLEEATDVSAGDGGRQALVAALRATLAAQTGITDATVTGSAVINAELNRLSWHDVLILLPATAVVVMLVGFLLFKRKIGGILQVTMVSGMVVISTSILMLLTGSPFNMVSIALPGLLFTLAMASGLHVYQFAMQNPDLTPANIMATLIQPVMVSHITTGLGFGTMATISVIPVESMAFWGSVGVLWSGLHVSVVLPTLLRWSNTTAPLFDFMAPRWIPPLVGMLSRVAKHRVKVLGVGLGFSALLIALIGLIKVDSTYLNMVAPGEQMRADYARLEQAELPSAQLAILLSTNSKAGLVDPAFNTALRDLSQRLMAIKGVRKVIGPAEIYAELAPMLAEGKDRAGFDADSAQVTDAYVFALTAGNHEIARYMTEDLQHFRVLVLFDYMSNSALRDLVQNHITPATKAAMADLPAVSQEVSGLTLLWANMDNAILSSQVSSVGILAITCFGLFLLSTRRVMLALVATIVNVLPVAIIAAAMGLIGLPLDMAAVFILGLLLGIAIDDTSFYLHLYTQIADDVDPGAWLQEVLAETAPAMLATSVMITSGFAVLLVSSFVPIQNFGLFTALGILCATLCDVFLLTLLLIMFPRTHKKA